MRPIVLAVCRRSRCLFVSPAAAQTTDTTPLVSADGIGIATLTPDIADFTVTVSRLRADVRRAPARRRTAGSLPSCAPPAHAAWPTPTSPRAGCPSRASASTRRGRLVRVRYRAEQTLVIRARNVGDSGRAARRDRRGRRGPLGDPDFGFADPSAGRLLATRAALADARKRADDAAATRGCGSRACARSTLAPQTMRTSAATTTRPQAAAAVSSARRPHRPRSRRACSSSPSGFGWCTPPRRCSAGGRRPVRAVVTPAPRRGRAAARRERRERATCPAQAHK